MSLFDHKNTGILPLALTLALSASMLSACQVRPLHGGLTTGEAYSIQVSPASSRVEQVVRNDIVFKFGGGAGEAVNAAYTLDLKVNAGTAGVLAAGSGNDYTAARTTVSAIFTLKSTGSGETILTGSRSATALLDLPSQQFAQLRAIRDSEDRAAHSLAAMINADILAKIAR